MKSYRLLFVGILTLLSALCAGAAPDPTGELIFPPQGKHVHSSSVVELPNGDLLACWFHGSGERGANDVQVQGARLTKGAGQWGPVFQMADTPNLPDCNPVLFLDPQKRLWLFWAVVRANGWEHVVLKYRRAEKYLEAGPPEWSWQDVIILTPGDEFAEAVKRGFGELGYDEPMWAEYAPKYTAMVEEAARDKEKQQSGWMPRTHPIALPSGRLLLPLYNDGYNLSLAALSDDQGETWRSSLPMVGLGPIQPSVVRKKDGSLLAYLRDSGIAPSRALLASSKDDGATWSVARDTDIPNPGSSLEVVALADGNWVMVFNDTEDDRYRLSIAMSDDEGASWKWKRVLEEAAPGAGSFAYPSVIQGKDGRIQITYSYSVKGGESIKHIVVDPEWLKQ